MDILEMEGKEAVEQVILKEDVRKLYEAYEQNLKDTGKDRDPSEIRPFRL